MTDTSPGTRLTQHPHMALPKKGTRTITVEGVRYRWLIRKQPTYCEGAFATHFSVAVERAEPPGACALLLGAGFPRPDNWLGEPSISVTPRLVAASIRAALAAGWRPERKGSAFEHPLQAGGQT